MRSQARPDPSDRAHASGASPAFANNASAAPPRFQPAAPPAPPADEPAWKREFRKAYGLTGAELVRRVAPPYPPCRAEYFRDLIREAYRRTRSEPPEPVLNRDYSDYFTKFAWKDGWTVNRLLAQYAPIKPQVGVALGQLLRMTTGFGPTRTEGDAELLDRKVTGDFVVRTGADPEKLAAALQKLLRKECELPVSLTVRQAERDVFVLSGNYQARPLAGRNKNQIEVYASELLDRGTGGGGTGTLREMVDYVEGFIEAPVELGEVKGAPWEVHWHFNFRSPFTDEQHAQDRDPDAVMKNITAQTGLTVKREKRKIKVLVVKKAS